MKRQTLIPLALFAFFLAGCSKTREASAAAPTAPHTVTIATVTATRWSSRGCGSARRPHPADASEATEASDNATARPPTLS